MTLLLVVALVALVVGAFCGWGLAVMRTDRLLAAMTPDEIRVLGARVRARRQRDGAGNG